MLAMVLEPGVQQRAQEELDRVVGKDRLPSYHDKDSLPFINSIVWESLRWNPVTPIGIAHCLIEDDEYKGYRIPKDTTIMPNVW
jgi:cytochrome P450